MIKTPSSTVIGGAGIWTPSATILGSLSNLAQLIKSIFANNEQGIGWDLNDFSTLYQDAAGTIPVTGVGQPVGLVLDKSKGLALGVELITQPLDFANWSKTVAVTSFTANSFTTNAGGGVTLPLFAGVSGKAYRITMKGTSTVAGTLRNGGTGSVSAVIPVGAFDIVMNTPTLASFGTTLYIALGSAGTVTVDSISVKELSGNHAFQSVSASRPLLQRNATTGAYYLAFDGVDDFLQTNNIDFTATDKVSLFTAVNIPTFKFAPVCELSGDPNLNSGTFALSIDDIPKNANMRSRGTAVLRDAAAVLAAGVTTVLSGKASISNDYSLLRKNAVQTMLNNADQGAGNYGNYPLFIARRGGTNPNAFNGHIYSLICISRLTTDAETLALEKAIAKLTGVTLNV